MLYNLHPYSCIFHHSTGLIIQVVTLQLTTIFYIWNILQVNCNVWENLTFYFVLNFQTHHKSSCAAKRVNNGQRKAISMPRRLEESKIRTLL